MRNIIEKEGKFYVEETRAVGEITLPVLEDQLAKMKAQKKSVLAAKAAEYDRSIAEVESEIAQIKKLQKRQAARPKKPRTTKGTGSKAGKGSKGGKT